MTSHDIQNCEALLIKKTPFGESDVAATLFTKEFGKISTTAKNAVLSRKRFGGRLQRFARLNVELSVARSGKKILQNAEVSERFENLAKDMETFLKANCLLELIDVAVTEEETPCEKIFSESMKTLSLMNRGNGCAAMLRFQTVSLENLGYGIDVSRCGGCGHKNFTRGYLIFPTGQVLCGDCMRNSTERPFRKFNREAGVGNREAALENTCCLNAFFQYQTGTVLKSAKILEDMCK